MAWTNYGGVSRDALDAHVEYTPATEEEVLEILKSELIHDRTEWNWFRFPDGTLLLGVFPVDEVYEEIKEELERRKAWQD